jgi:hypothetical protein
MVHTTTAALCLSFHDIRRQLQDSISAQRERIARMEQRLTQRTTKPPPHPASHMIAVAASGLALACAWRLVSEKWRFEVQSLYKVVIRARPSSFCLPRARCKRTLSRLRVAGYSSCLVSSPAASRTVHRFGTGVLLHDSDAAQAEETALQNIIAQQQQEIERCGLAERDADPWACSACAVSPAAHLLCTATARRQTRMS